MGAAFLHVGTVFAITLVLTTRAMAATLYVSPVESDVNPGTLAAPLATPGKALALAAAGDPSCCEPGRTRLPNPVDHPGVAHFSVLPRRTRKDRGGTADLQHLTSVVVVYPSGVTIEDLELQGAVLRHQARRREGPTERITIRRVNIHHTGRDGIKSESAEAV